MKKPIEVIEVKKELIPDEQAAFFWAYKFKSSDTIYYSGVNKTLEDAIKYKPTATNIKASRLIKVNVGTEEIK